MALGMFSDNKGKQTKKKATTREELISTEDKKFISRVLDDFEAAKEKKDTTQWIRYDEYVNDDQWDASTDDEDDWKPQPQVNVCWSILRTIHSNMTSGNTSINITCKKPVYDDYARDLNDVITAYWDELDMDTLISEAEWIRPKIGSVALKTCWNPSKNEGKGDIDCEVVHPANVFVDPNVTNPRHIQSAEFIDFVKPCSVNYILNRYTKEKDKLCKYKREQLHDMLEYESDTSDTEIYGDTMAGNFNGVPTTVTGVDYSVSRGGRNIVKLHEYWYKDDEGKLQVAWMAGKVLLKNSTDDDEIKQNGFYEHGMYPLVYIPYIFRDKRLDGRSALQSHVTSDGDKDGIQDIVNILLQDYLVSEKMMGQGLWIYRHGALKNPDKLRGEAGLRIAVKNDVNADIRREAGINQNDLLPAIEAILTHSDRISGQWDVTQGRQSSAIKTLGQTSLLLEQAMKPQADAIKTMNQGLRELVELWIAHLSEFVTESREYTREVNGQTESFEFNPSMMMKAPGRMKDETGNVVDTDGENRLYFKVTVDIGATLAMTKAFQMEIAFSLWQNKLIDMQGVYDLLPEFKGKSQTLERMMQPPPPPTPPQTETVPQTDQEAEEAQMQQVQEFVMNLPPEIQEIIAQMGDQAGEHVMGMMQMQPEDMEMHMQQMMNMYYGAGMQDESQIPAMA